MNALYEQRINYDCYVNPGVYTQIRSELEAMGYPRYFAPIPIPRQPEPIPFSRLLKFWLQVKEGEVRESSFAIYEYIIYKHLIPYFDKLGIHVHEIQLMDIQQYLNKMGKSLKQSTLDKHFTVINGALRFARFNLNLICSNPAEGYNKPKKNPRIYCPLS